MGIHMHVQKNQTTWTGDEDARQYQVRKAWTERSDHWLREGSRYSTVESDEKRRKKEKREKRKEKREKRKEKRER